MLTKAIERDAGDARFFSFRVLARSRLGQARLALDDFRAGGEAERQGSSGAGRALERIQGSEWLVVVRFRP